MLGVLFLLVLHMVCIITSASACRSLVKSQRGDSGIHLFRNEKGKNVRRQINAYPFKQVGKK